LFGNRRRTDSGAGVAIRQPKPASNALIDCLGEAFDSLPDVVKRAHRGTVQLTGTVRVERGGGLGGLIAAIMRLPKSDPVAELVVVAWHFVDQVAWSRSFDGRKFESTFLKEGEFLVEQMGPISLTMQPTKEGGRLVYRLVATHLGPVPLPRALRPSMTAWEGERDGKYEFEVAVGLPLAGRVIRYSGMLDVETLAE